MILSVNAKRLLTLQSKKGTKHLAGWLQFAQERSSSDSNQGGACIFYKENLGVLTVKSLSFNECINCEVSIRVMLVLYIAEPR